MQRRELAQLTQLRLHVTLDPHDLAEALAAVHDPMTDRVGLGQPRPQRLTQLVSVNMSARRRELCGCECRVIGIEQ